MSERVPVTFKVEGVMALRNGELRKFTLYVRGLSESEVLEKVYSILGGRHKVTRKHIKVLSAKPVSGNEIDDNYVKSLSETTILVVK